jgi:hypothetical protein
MAEGDAVFAAGEVTSNLGAGMSRPLPVVYSPTTAGNEDNGLLNVSFTVTEKAGQRALALRGYAVEQRSSRIEWRCEEPGGEAGVYVACPKLVIDNIQQGQNGAAVIKLHNLGSEVLHLSRVYIESDSGRWFIDRGFFEAGEGRLESEVQVPQAEGADPVSVRNFVTGDCSLEETGDPDLPLSLDITYVAREVGADEATLVVISDDPFKPEIRIPLQGIGNGRKGEVSPSFLVVSSGDTSTVTIKSLGNTPFPVNGVFLDLDGDGESGEGDFNCRPGERSQDEGELSCSSARGSGFQLEAYDGAEGGRDEAEIVISHWGGVAARSQLVFKSNTLSVGNLGGLPGFFFVPIGGAADAQLAASTSGDLTFAESEGSYSGSVEVTLTNAGGADAEISGLTVLSSNGAPAGPESLLGLSTTVTVADQEPDYPLTVTAGGSLVIKVSLGGSAGSTWPETVRLVLQHDAVATQPLPVQFGLVTPQ